MMSPLSPLAPWPDRLLLDPTLEFIAREGGAIELTEAGFRRLAQAHSAGLDAVIEIDNHAAGNAVGELLVGLSACRHARGHRHAKPGDTRRRRRQRWGRFQVNSHDWTELSDIPRAGMLDFTR